MSKGTVFFVRNGRIVEPGVPSIHDPEYQEILKNKKALCKEYGIQMSDIDDDSCIVYSMITAIKSLLHDDTWESDDDSLKCVSRILNEIEEACNYEEQEFLKQKFLNTIDDIKKNIVGVREQNKI